MISILWLLIGLGILTAGAELLVRGAVGLAAACGVSPLVVGLTVVAFGTSSPELVVSIHAAHLDKADVALGNVVGSNIFNVLLILGLCAIIAPLKVSRQLIRVEAPLLIGLSLAVGLMSWDHRLSRWNGLLMVLALVAYTTWLIWTSRRENRSDRSDDDLDLRLWLLPRGAAGLLVRTLMSLAGLGLLVLGSHWFVGAAIDLARAWGVSELVIGLTIVAAGTSLPELATSALAAARGQRDIAVGNVIGSNIFNLLGVLGISSLISTEGIRVSETALRVDIPVMIFTAIICLPIFFTGRRIDRWEGGLFLAIYVAYTGYLLLSSPAPPIG